MRRSRAKPTRLRLIFYASGEPGRRGGDRRGDCVRKEMPGADSCARIRVWPTPILTPSCRGGRTGSSSPMPAAAEISSISARNWRCARRKTIWPKAPRKFWHWPAIRLPRCLNSAPSQRATRRLIGLGRDERLLAQRLGILARTEQRAAGAFARGAQSLPFRRRRCRNQSL